LTTSFLLAKAEFQDVPCTYRAGKSTAVLCGISR
jgi:hypothetical protein